MLPPDVDRLYFYPVKSSFAPAIDRDALLERASRYDPRALAELHDLFYPQVYRYVAYRLNDPQVCEDISSEVFVRYLDVLKKKGRSIQSTRAWLLGTAHHLVMDFYRHKYRRPLDNLADHDNLPDHRSLEGDAEFRETHQEVSTALLKLTEDQQHVITLRFSQELSLEETAQLMGKTVNAVKVLQYRALAALRRQLDRS